MKIRRIFQMVIRLITAGTYQAKDSENHNTFTEAAATATSFHQNCHRR